MLRMCFIREMSEREREREGELVPHVPRCADGKRMGRGRREKKKTIKISASPTLSFRV